MRKREENLECRRSGEEYVTKKGKRVRAKASRAAQLGCKCKHKCKNISHIHRSAQFALYRALPTEGQKLYISKLIDLLPVQRSVGSSEPETSKRQVTVSYRLQDEEGMSVAVCKGTFINTFGLTKHNIETIVKHKKAGTESLQEERGGKRFQKYKDEHYELVTAHINMIPRQESHYGRKDTNREYLSSDLSISSMHKAFLEKNPNVSISIEFYKKVVRKYFPNLYFQRPRVETSTTCDKLSCEMKTSQNEIEMKKAKSQFDAHHRKAEEARSKLAMDALGNLNTTCLTVDLQQAILVISVPSLTHSEMYYLRQLSCYNFGVRLSPSDEAFICLWNEASRARGSLEIATSIFTLLNNVKHFNNEQNLIIRSDNCAGQNKNQKMIFMYMFAIHLGLIKSVEHKFLVSGHSFLNCDRDFALIEKKKIKTILYTPSDVGTLISNTRKPPFKVVEMERFFSFKDGADFFLNTTPIAISSAVWLRVSKPGYVEVKRSFDKSGFETFNVWKRGRSDNDLDKFQLKSIVPKSLSEEKKKDLSKMKNLLPTNHREFYNSLIF